MHVYMIRYDNRMNNEVSLAFLPPTWKPANLSPPPSLFVLRSSKSPSRLVPTRHLLASSIDWTMDTELVMGFIQMLINQSSKVVWNAWYQGCIFWAIWTPRLIFGGKNQRELTKGHPLASFFLVPMCATLPGMHTFRNTVPAAKPCRSTLKSNIKSQY